MRPPAQRATIKQLLALVYLVVTVPAALFMLYFTVSIDTRIESAQRTNVDGDAFVLATNSDHSWLMALGQKIRMTKLPLSVSHVLRKDIMTNSVVARSLSDLRAAIIYVGGTIVLLGALLMWWLAIKLNQPLLAITESISRLARAEYVDPVSIQGPKNFREMGKGLEQLRLRLKNTDSHQRQFLRHISHEIKTPLTSIKEGSKLLEDEILGPINSEQREITNILNKSTGELQSSIENLLNHNAVTSVDRIKTRSMVNLASLVDDVLSKQALPIRTKKLKVIKKVSTSRAFVDSQQMATVFDNLLSNAIKYSPQNGTIKIWLIQNNKESVFTIRDYGPGVSEKNRNGIFDAFYIGDLAAHNTLKGTGLGLSIAKSYVEQHKGTIKLLNPRQGAAFQVTLKR